jgi:hypothetical protein
VTHDGYLCAQRRRATCQLSSCVTNRCFPPDPNHVLLVHVASGPLIRARAESATQTQRSLKLHSLGWQLDRSIGFLVERSLFRWRVVVAGGPNRRRKPPVRLDAQSGSACATDAGFRILVSCRFRLRSCTPQRARIGQGRFVIQARFRYKTAELSYGFLDRSAELAFVTSVGPRASNCADGFG